jgi:hypothetical protein
MVQQKNQAERLRIGVCGGWVPIQDAIAWADREIEQTPQPHPALIDLASTSNRHRDEVASLLAAVPGGIDRVASCGTVLPTCLKPSSTSRSCPPTLRHGSRRQQFKVNWPRPTSGRNRLRLPTRLPSPHKAHSGQKTKREIDSLRFFASTLGVRPNHRLQPPAPGAIPEAPRLNRNTLGRRHGWQGIGYRARAR